jgi:anti-sigma factor ChrR (cupin superfamily)
MSTESSKDRLDEFPDVVAALLSSVPDAALEPARRVRLRERVLAATAAKPEPLMRIQRVDEGQWVQLLPKLFLKPLRVDRDKRTQTSLWRLDPGARIPAHDHTGEEECLILEGSVSWDDTLYRRGDYLLARPGLRHTEFFAPDGALLLIRSELTPELEAAFMK